MRKITKKNIFILSICVLSFFLGLLGTWAFWLEDALVSLLVFYPTLISVSILIFYTAYHHIAHSKTLRFITASNILLTFVVLLSIVGIIIFYDGGPPYGIDFQVGLLLTIPLASLLFVSNIVNLFKLNLKYHLDKKAVFYAVAYPVIATGLYISIDILILYLRS